MGITPMYVGQTAPAAHLQIVDDSGAPPYPMDGSTTFSLLMHNVQTNTDQAGLGTFSLDDGVKGLVDYNWALADTETAGIYLLYITVNYGSGAILKADPIPFTIKVV